MTGEILAVCLSPKKGMKKRVVRSARLLAGHGLEGDGHAGDWHRQVSLLADESAETLRAKGLEVGPGSFAENLTTRGIDIPSLKVGQRLRIGASAVLEVTQIGKECHSRCRIYHEAGDCVMPREGVFARVLESGSVRPGDAVETIGPREAARP